MEEFLDTRVPVAEAPEAARSQFIVKTYLHLFGAILAFLALEVVFFTTPIAGGILSLISSAGSAGMLLVLGGFVGVSMLADRWARSSTSLGMQYAGLGLYVVAEALIFVPLLAYAMIVASNAGLGSFGLIRDAGIVTFALFFALTAVVMITRKDFSFMRSILMFGSFAAMGLIVASLLFGFTLGLAFSYAMVALACGYILFQTSAMLHQYDTRQYVAASLALFSSVALLFWYVLRIFISRRD